jgi:DNA-binding NarL/FixJ family response regulator
MGDTEYKVLSSFLAVTFRCEVRMPKSILIVDDSAAVRTTARCFLQNQLGLEVCGEAVDGLDALEKARHLKPDLIILDLSMPRMNGFASRTRTAIPRLAKPNAF